MGGQILMKEITELEQCGFNFLITDGMLDYKYHGRDSPDKSVLPLLSEIKANKEAAIAYLQSHYINTHEAIKQAYRGQLRQAVLLEPLPEWSDFWRESVWLCPNDASKESIRQNCPEGLALSDSEFFSMCELITIQGKDSQSVLECLKMFGGSLHYAPEVPIGGIVDPGRDMSPDDSDLWVQLLEMARVVDIDFAARLMYLRGTGCRLEEDGIGFKLRPIIDNEGRAGWTSQATFDAEEWCLNPYIEKLTELLKILLAKEEQGIVLPS